MGQRYRPLFDDLPPFAPPGAWEVDPQSIHTVVPGDFVTVEDGTALQAATGEAEKPFDLETGPLIRLLLVEAEDERILLVVVLTNLGSTFGTMVAIPLMVNVL